MDMMACSPLARCCGRSMSNADGRAAHLRGTRRPTSNCIGRCRRLKSKTISCGSATGATMNEAPELTEFLIGPAKQLELLRACLRRPISETGAGSHRNCRTELWRLASQSPCATGVCAGARDRARAARSLCPTAAGHPHHSHLRSTRVRYSADFSAMVRRRTSVSSGLLSQREQWRGHEVRARRRVLNDPELAADLSRTGLRRC